MTDPTRYQLWAQPLYWGPGSGPPPWWAQGSEGTWEELSARVPALQRAHPTYRWALVARGSFPITWQRHQELASDSVELATFIRAHATDTTPTP